MALVETCMSGILGCGLGLKEGVCTRIIWSYRFGGVSFGKQLVIAYYGLIQSHIHH